MCEAGAVSIALGPHHVQQNVPDSEHGLVVAIIGVVQTGEKAAGADGSLHLLPQLGHVLHRDLHQSIIPSTTWRGVCRGNVQERRWR